MIAGAAREIALAFGVPPLLLGLPGDNTFSNYAEANRAFWRQTVLPLVARVQKSFQSWLQPGFGAFRLDYNADRLEALASERAAEWERVGKAAFLTLDEQREALGYGPAPKEALVAKRDVALERRYSPDQPRVPAGSSGTGRWTDGGGGGGFSSGGSLVDRAFNNELSSGPNDVIERNPRTRIAQNQDDRRYSVVLKDEEGYGHTLRDHVNKEDRELMEEVEKERQRFTLPGISIISYSPAEGAFDSWEAANDFVNRTLEANRELVDAVAEGRLQSASLKKNFGTRTGKEAYLSSGLAAPVVRNTYWVRVVIHADPMHPKGYRVRTAYPFNQLPSKQLRWRAQ